MAMVTVCVKQMATPALVTSVTVVQTVKQVRDECNMLLHELTCRRTRTPNLKVLSRCI